MGFNFRNELYNKLGDDEWELSKYYIEKAQDYYDHDKDAAAKECLLDAVAVCKAKHEYNVANKINYYTRFC